MDRLGSVQVVAEEQSRLARELRDLPADTWFLPSRCAGWSNIEVLAHLTAGAELYFDSVSRALSGDAGPPTGADGREVPVEEYRDLLPNRQRLLAQEDLVTLLDRFAATGDRLFEVFRGLSLANEDMPAWHPRGTRTIGVLVQLRLFELAFHDWDIRASIDPRADIRREVSRALLHTVRQAQSRLCRPDPDLSGTCRFVVDGERWTVRVDAGALTEVEAETVPIATIRTDASTYLLLSTGRRALTERMDRVAVEGDRVWVERLLDTIRFSV